MELFVEMSLQIADIFSDRDARCWQDCELKGKLSLMAVGSLHFLCRLIPPRPNFSQTMTPEERTIMQQHVGYWSGKVASGEALLFGPVADPAGGYGIGVVSVTDAADMATLRNADPAMRANVGFRYDVLPMPAVVMKQTG